MKTVPIDEKTVLGISVRTKNSDEMQPQTAKIGELWQQFYQDIVPKLQNGATIFGLYSNYESDASGEFTVMACSDEVNESASNELEQSSIQKGNYLVFEGTGEMPHAVINTWSNIWDYFSSDTQEYQRAYTTDFELYKSPNEIEIYISVK